MLVVDASVAVPALISATGLAPLAREHLVAPPLLWSEVLSATRALAWRGVLERDVARAAADSLSGVGIERVLPPELYREAWGVAARLGWAKTYDAEYVALARLLDARLLTLDARLRRAVGRLVRVVAPSEL